MAESFECGAFMEKFTVQPSPSPVDHQHKLLLSGLTFAVKDMSISKYGNRFDVDGYETGFENPDWARTHSAATSTVPAILDILRAGATCVGKTMIDEMADGHEFRKNHTEWVNKVKPDIGPGIPGRVWEAIRSTDENVDVCNSVRSELRAILTSLLEVLNLCYSFTGNILTLYFY